MHLLWVSQVHVLWHTPIYYAQSKRLGTRQVHDDHPVSAILPEPSGEGVYLAPGLEWGSQEGSQHGPLHELFHYVDRQILWMAVADGPVYPVGKLNMRNRTILRYPH